VINSINQRANEILLSYKSMSNDIIQIAKRQAQLMDRVKTSGMIDEGMVTDMNEVCSMLMEFSDNTMTKMEEACGFIEGLPAVIEGDTGIYVKETMPVAPLLRREDGSTMKQHVYGPVLQRAHMNNKVNEMVDSIPTRVSNPMMPINTVGSTNSGLNSTRGTNLIEEGDRTYNEVATQIIVTHMRESDFGDEITSRQVYENIKAYVVKYKNLNTDLFTIMVTIVSERMSMNGGETVSGDEIETMLLFLGGGTIEDITESAEIFGDAVMNRSSLKKFFDDMHQSMHE
jgi:hypothetical protein